MNLKDFLPKFQNETDVNVPIDQLSPTIKPRGMATIVELEDPLDQFPDDTAN